MSPRPKILCIDIPKRVQVPRRKILACAPLLVTVHHTSLLSLAKGILFIGLHFSRLELPGRHLSLKQNVNLVIGSVLELREPVETPDSTGGGERDPEEGGFALPVESAGVDHVRIQDVEDKAVNLCLGQFVISRARRDLITYSVHHSRKGNGLIPQSGGGGFTQNSIAGRAQQASVADHECLMTVLAMSKSGCGSVYGTHHLECGLDPTGVLVASVSQDRSNPHDHQVDGREHEAGQVERPSPKEIHEPHIYEIGKQLNGRRAETEAKCSLLRDSSLLKDKDDVAGEDDTAHLLQEPGHDGDFGSAQIGTLEDVKPPGCFGCLGKLHLHLVGTDLIQASVMAGGDPRRVATVWRCLSSPCWPQYHESAPWMHWIPVASRSARPLPVFRGGLATKEIQGQSR